MLLGELRNPFSVSNDGTVIANSSRIYTFTTALCQINFSPERSKIYSVAFYHLQCVNWNETVGSRKNTDLG